MNQPTDINLYFAMVWNVDCNSFAMKCRLFYGRFAIIIGIVGDSGHLVCY